MPLLDPPADPRRSTQVLFALFSLLVLVAPFYYQDNLGGEGLSLPFNATVWLPATLIMGAGVLTMLRRGVWIKPAFLGLILLLPALLLVAGFITGIQRPGEWAVRLGVVVGGVLFWFALFQFDLRARDRENLLYILLASILLHAMVGLVQVSADPFLKGWIPVSEGRLLGMFQQPNLQGSLMATGLAVALYLTTTSFWSVQRWPMRALVYLVIILTVGQVIAAGSRVALLGALVVLALISVGCLRVLLKDRKTLLLLIMALVAGLGVGSALNERTGGLEYGGKKLYDLSSVETDNRYRIYDMSLDAYLRAPWVGHGIGSFQREFQNEKVEYMANGGRNVGNQRFSHPHNELLFWMIETGTLGLLGLLAAALGVFAALWRAGGQKGLALAALLIPITLHTMVELPFYISTFHWLVLLILLWYVFASIPTRERPVRLSRAMAGMLVGLSLLTVPLVGTFLTHALVAQTGVMQYLKSRGQQVMGLNYAMNNLYFNEMATYFVMRQQLFAGLQQESEPSIQGFVDWGREYIQQIPDIQLYADLAVAYDALEQTGQARETLAEALSIYPGHAPFVALEERLVSGEALYVAPSAASVSSTPMPVK